MSQINLFDVNEPVFRPANYKPVSKEEKLRRENEILKQAEAILVERYNQRLTGDTVSGVTDLFRIVRTALAKEDMTRERFLGVYLNQRHKVIAVEVLFEGTIAAAAVYPREVVKRALELGAAGMAFAHNHPSGDPEPSGNDIAITKRLQTALDLVEIRVLDHIIVGTFDDYHSFAESGLL